MTYRIIFIVAEKVIIDRYYRI